LTATTISSSLNRSIQGASVTFSAGVTSANGAPPNGETVTFMMYQSVLGTGVLSSGAASLTLSALPVGDNPIKAVFVGDSNFSQSTSTPVNQVVTK
jgi:hypothetical protein